MNDYQLSQKVLESAFRVHSELGPGLLESAYQTCLGYDLSQNGLFTEKEKQIPIVYKGISLDCGFRIDLLVEKRIILEIKSVQSFAPIHLAQTLTYLKLANLRYALLLNFNVSSLRDGIKRVVSGHDQAD